MSLTSPFIASICSAFSLNPEIIFNSSKILLTLICSLLAKLNNLCSGFFSILLTMNSAKSKTKIKSLVCSPSPKITGFSPPNILSQKEK